MRKSGHWLRKWTSKLPILKDMKKAKKPELNKAPVWGSAIEILEIKRHFNPNYTKGDKDGTRHFLSHEEDPFTEEEIESQVKSMEYIRSLPPKQENNITKLKPKFRHITGEEMKIEENGELPF